MTEFCNSCNTYLAWDPANGPDERTVLLPVGGVPAVRPGTSPPAVDPGSGRRAGERLRIAVEPTTISVIPGLEPAMVSVHVINLSSVVDRFTVELLSAPPFVTAVPAEVRLLPNADQSVDLRIGLVPAPMAPAGRYPIDLRVRSSAHQGVAVSQRVDLTVGVVDGPVTLTVTPSIVRVRDTSGGQTELLAENTGGNRPLSLRLEGSDPERLVRFIFEPARLDIPPGGQATARVRLQAPEPPPGQELTRSFTVTAIEGTREFTTTGTFTQASTAQQVDLRLEPSVTKIRDVGAATIRLVAAVAGGPRPVRLTLQGSDDERAVRFTFTPPVLVVPPGGAGVCTVRLEAPEPEPGQEISRRFTIGAHDGRGEIAATGTLTQSTSAQNLALWLEPNILRVRDAGAGYLNVVLDNRSGRRPQTVTLSGSDPERAVRFGFGPPVVQIGPGEILTAQLRVDAALPPDGQEVERPLTVVGTSHDGRRVEGTGSFVQTSSASILELRLDPSVVRIQDASDAVVTLIADNRESIVPARIQLEGSDPERAVRFDFQPSWLDIPPGGWASSRLHLRASRPERGKELTRQITVTAVDERREVSTTGSLIQTSSDRRPMIGRLLTLLGCLLMIAGVFLPWTTAPRRITGINFSLPEFAEDTNISLKPLHTSAEQLRHVPAALISAGLIVLLFATLTLFGLTGTKGRLIRTMAMLGFLFVVGFSLAFVVRADTFGPGIGLIMVATGAVCAFAGGVVGRR
ncbi:hypothetical protein SAMN04515671_4507 [Nakamurella panacisegetis]|uniref:Uncharacterized protein n=2 Tax=Nakamurella panacisegetis TaxID=1090615 RepID=A0A1H0T7H9_9ACTN|nr:hypothetical protein SAMN04515671_4507 [Nakamurella panacisegetis]